MDAAIHIYRTAQRVPLTSAGLLYTPSEWNHLMEGHGENTEANSIVLFSV